ncbi:phage tail sheath protein [Paracoccus gahaiensis]|uniref:Phage tail sheath protein n=1 Tax=Paracoccus gahaiensis TaxID=1706839 RepID=A0A4U0RSH9_9RHOB|nr:phage tail sheath C-terminal domain-containing protein [Paracoccus gahaiensis]TJZ91294.1 phage tail sheath protein [Paracoccus gahaiensis]
MCALTAPGLYPQPVAPVRALGRLSRGDVAVFLGYARRGPVDMPVRVESLTLADEIFGPALEGGYLHAGLKGFFENGGRTAYVIRLAPDAARPASVMIGGGWVAQASFGWSLVDPRERKREARPDEATWVQLVEDVFRTTGPRSPAPGAWANGYEVRIARTQRARTESLIGPLDDPRALRLRSMTGIEAHSVLELAQTREGVTRVATVSAAGVDAARQRVLLPLRVTELRDGDGVFLDLAPDLPVQVTSVEFDVEIWSRGRLEQAFRALSPDPRHSAPIAGTLATASRSVSLHREGAPGGIDWSDPEVWPPEGRFPLTGGRDGLEAITRGDWIRGLRQVARLDEVALIAAPDLVLQPLSPEPAELLPPDRVDCCDLSPRPLGKLVVQVREDRPDGTQEPVVGVEVDVLGPGGRVRTDLAGIFRATGVPVGLVTVRLSKDGFEPLEAVAQAEPFLPSQPVILTMARLNLPRALAEDEILEVVAAMVDPGIVGPYKVAIIDPPSPQATLDQIRGWRSRLAGSNRMAFFAPWLRLPSTDEAGRGGVRPCPPSGYVCGAFAQAELTVGIHRTGANLPLRFAEGVMLDIDEAAAGLLNPAGINAIRSFPGRGIRIYGTRTLSPDPDWRYLTARRVVDAIEKTLERGLHWMVFEPNNLMTRHAVAQSARVLLNRLWREGVLAGSAPDEAFSVKCDLENNPVEGRDAGQLVIDIGVAPTTPFEFVLFRLGNAFDALKVTEDAP